MHFKEAIVLGVMGADGTILSNPSEDEVIQKGDSFFGFATDQRSFKPCSVCPFPECWFPSSLLASLSLWDCH